MTIEATEPGRASFTSSINSAVMSSVLTAAPVTDAMRAVFVELLVHGPLSRAETARRLALSPSALTKLTKPLLEDGYLLHQSTDERPALGRPSQPLAVDPGRTSLLGIKLTADELFAVRTDLRAQIQRELRLDLPSQEVDRVVAMIAQAVQDLSVSGRPPAAVGISLAGTASAGDPVVHTSPFLGWNDVALGDLVAEATGLPTIVENDVRALTAAQQWFGAGVGYQSFALVTVGVGIGCGLVIGDRVVRSLSRGTGMVGHLAIDGNGPLCEMGHRGCARAYASSSAIQRSIMTTLGRTELTFDECLTLAREGQRAARRVFDEAGRAVGRVVATIANITGVELVILSGETVQMFDVCADAFETSLAEHTHWTSTPVKVAVRPFTFSEWARGAAVAALQHQLLDR